MLFYIAAGLTVAVFIHDRKEGFWNRTLLAGVSTVEMMIAHISVHSIVILIQLLEVIVLVALIFDTENHGSYFTVVLILALLGLSGMFFGLLLSCICADFMQANLVMTGISQPMIVLAGMFWPLEGMPAILKYISYTMPFTLPAVSMTNIMAKGYSIFHPSVMKGLGVVGIWTVAGVYLGLKALKLRKYSRNT